METVLSWFGNPAAVGLQARPFVEDLVQSDRATGQGVPDGLSTAWVMAPDALSWTYTLRENVPFHFGFGEFTNRDVIESILRLTNPEALSTQGNLYKDLLGDTDAEMLGNIDTPDDHTIIFKFLKPALGFFNMTRNLDGSTYIYSQAQIEQEGLDGMEAYIDSGLRIAGTGAWMYVEQKIREGILYEATDNHYRQTPEFDELEFIWVEEPATRLAMLLNNETDATILTREQYPTATAAGMEVVSATLGGVGQILFWYNWDDDEFVDGTRGLNPPYDNPLFDVRVREAMAHAVDEEAMMVAMLGELGNKQYMHSAQPGTEGFQQRFIDEWDEKYGFDQAKSRQLLADAGYAPGEVSFTMVTSEHTNPENILAAEILAPMFEAVGFDVTIDIWERSGRLIPELLAKTMHGIVDSWSQSQLPNDQITNIFYNTAGCCQIWRDLEIDQLYLDYEASIDPVEREQIMSTILGIRYDFYAGKPIGIVPLQMVVNPAIVAEWIFPGVITSKWVYTEYVKFGGG